MTVFEKVKPGLEFVFGKKNVRTIKSAAQVLEEHLDCDNCPMVKQCNKEISLRYTPNFNETIPYDLSCTKHLIDYLKSEVNT